MSDLVKLSVDTQGIAQLSLNRVDARNALSAELIDAMNAAIVALAASIPASPMPAPTPAATSSAATVPHAASGTESFAVAHAAAAFAARAGAATPRVLILSGEGKVFCAGMDLKGVLHDPVRMGGMLRGLSQFCRHVRRLPIPTIARVQGAAVGGGCGLMVVTDFSFTHPQAKVGYPEVDLGVCPAVVAPWLIKRIGAGRARAMLLAGGTMTGEEGHRAGLATHLVPLEALESESRALAGKLCTGGAHALAVTKRWMNELDGSMEDGPSEKAAELSAQVIAGDEAQTRLRAMYGMG